MLILGENNDDKGTQLEVLTRQLLEHRGCVNVRTNEIGPGGQEIDVSADAPIPGIGQQQVVRVLCESKAHKNPIDITQWLKFLGKIFVEEVERGTNVAGYFIALGGVNGNVAGNYNTLKIRRSNIVLLDGENLLSEVSHLYPLAELHEVEANLRLFTNRLVREYDVAYYDRNLYRVALFEDDSYTLLDASAQPLPNDERLDKLKVMIERFSAAKNYVDLPQEAEARRRDLCAQLALLSQLMIDGGTTTPTRILTEIADIVPCTVDELNRAIEVLTQREWIERAVDDQVRFAELADSLEGIGRFVEIFGFMVSPKQEGVCDGRLFVRVFGCPYYDAHINQHLAEYVKITQANLPLTDDESQKIIELCRLSPSALIHATQPDPNLVVHRTEHMPHFTDEQKEMFDTWGRDYLIRTLYHLLMRDFQRPGPRTYFYELRGLREIEIRQILRVKSENRVELEDTTFERRTILPLMEEYLAPDGGGKYATGVALVEGNPWDDTPDA